MMRVAAIVFFAGVVVLNIAAITQNFRTFLLWVGIGVAALVVLGIAEIWRVLRSSSQTGLHLSAAEAARLRQHNRNGYVTHHVVVHHVVHHAPAEDQRTITVIRGEVER